MGRWRYITESLDASTLRLRVEHDGAALTMHQAIALLEADAAFRASLTEALRAAPFEAFFWETPPVSRSNPGRFEHVLTAAPGLARATAEPRAFEEHWARSDQPVVVFENLGRDATLIVPRPLGPPEAYVHLAKFLRSADEAQIDCFFAAIGQAVSQRLTSRPAWLSTAGMGVHWLHARIDSRPKYYRYQPYRREV